MPSPKAFPEEPTKANPVIVVPKMLMNNMNGPIEWLATK